MSFWIWLRERILNFGFAPSGYVSQVAIAQNLRNGCRHFSFDVSVTHAALRAVKTSNTESEVLICYENQIVKWFVSADPNTYLRMIPTTLPECVPDVNGETDVYGDWLDLYEGSVHQEVFHTYGTQKLVLLSGKRKED